MFCQHTHITYSHTSLLGHSPFDLFCKVTGSDLKEALLQRLEQGILSREAAAHPIQYTYKKRQMHILT